MNLVTLTRSEMNRACLVRRTISFGMGSCGMRLSDHFRWITAFHGLTCYYCYTDDGPHQPATQSKRRLGSDIGSDGPSDNLVLQTKHARKLFLTSHFD
jgi:hypothetical protein